MRIDTIFVWLFLAVFSASRALAEQPPAAPAASLNAEARIARLADRYARTGTFKARFEQRYESSSFGAEVQGSGTVIVVPDGRMLWEYRSPQGRRGAVDGEIWWMLDPRDRQVIVREGVDATDGPLARLLSGRLRTLEGFVATEGGGPAATPTHRLIELTPLTPRDDLERLIVETDADSTTLVRVSIVDTLGNRSEFAFGPPQRCSIPPASAFKLVVPKGYDLVRE